MSRLVVVSIVYACKAPLWALQVHTLPCLVLAHLPGNLVEFGAIPYLLERLLLLTVLLAEDMPDVD